MCRPLPRVILPGRKIRHPGSGRSPPGHIARVQTSHHDSSKDRDNNRSLLPGALRGDASVAPNSLVGHYVAGVASAAFSHASIVSAPRAAVWPALDLPETWNAVAGVERVHAPRFDDTGRLQGFLFDTVVAGRAYEGRAIPAERIEGSVMSWNIANSQVKGLIRVRLDDEGGETKLTVDVELEGVSMMSRMLFGAIAETVRQGLPRTVDAMAAQLAEASQG